MATVCAIHQPNFFPWLGYFDKIRRADVFIFLDDVAFPKSGSGMGCWSNRVRIKIQGRPAWFGCPVRREKGKQVVRSVRIDDLQPWRRKLLRTLEVNYSRAPNVARTLDLIRPLLEQPTDDLAEFNIGAVQSIAGALGLESRYLRQSELGVSGAGTELLVNLTKAAGASVYLAGGGAAGYQRDEVFCASGLQLAYQNFAALPYGDPRHFIRGLSVIDYLMEHEW